VGPLTIHEVQVQNYRNIEDSGWVPFEQVTALVGRNESGKTAFLKALHKFNAANGETYDPQKDFPRDRYTRDFKEPADWPVCSVRFKVAKEYAEALKQEHGLDVLITSVEITKNYANAATWNSTPNVTDDLVPADALITALEKFQKASRRLDSKVVEQRERDQKEREKLVATATNLLDAAGKFNALRSEGGIKLLTQARDQINALSTPLAATVVEDFVGTANALLKRAQSPSKRDAVFKALWDKTPVFIYFENYGVLNSAIYLPHFLDEQKVSPNDARVRTIAAMFKHVNLSAKEVSALGEEKATAARQAGQAVNRQVIEQEERQKEERAIKLNSASNDITARFSAWWRQRRHKIRYHADGQYFRIWIADDRRPGVEIELESRSKGFQWFFSFYLVFLVESEDGHKEAVLLLDEPGLHLHPTAQQELIAFFETLSKSNQLVYSTHSPFLIDGDHLERVRPVTETAEGNSKIAIGYWPEDRDTIFPLQAAAGYAMVQALFQHKKNVLIEGMGDYYLIYALALLCRATGREGLAPDVYATPCGGAKNVGPIASLFLGQQVRAVVLLDGDDQGRVRKSALTKELYSGHERSVLLLSDVLGVKECEIEDIVGEDNILPILNELIGKRLKLEATNAGKRSVADRIEDAAASAGVELPEGWKPEVARRLASKWAVSDPSKADTAMLDRAQKLFKMLNERFDQSV
jgi:predicted ATP-dependent endonuclease of OLD family